jgi:hypothetical protein
MNRWDKKQYTHIAEAEFLDEIGKKVFKSLPPWYSQSTQLRILPPSPLEQKCNVNNVYGNLKSRKLNSIVRS